VEGSGRRAQLDALHARPAGAAAGAVCTPRLEIMVHRLSFVPLIASPLRLRSFTPKKLQWLAFNYKLGSRSRLKHFRHFINLCV
jgi:hypothetical protein